MNVAYDPEKFGLKTIGEINFIEESYEYDYRIIWLDTETKIIYTARDSGCSCPVPFEDFTKETLDKFETVRGLELFLREEVKDAIANGYRNVARLENVDRVVEALEKELGF